MCFGNPGILHWKSRICSAAKLHRNRNWIQGNHWDFSSRSLVILTLILFHQHASILVSICLFLYCWLLHLLLSPCPLCASYLWLIHNFLSVFTFHMAYHGFETFSLHQKLSALAPTDDMPSLSVFLDSDLFKRKFDYLRPYFYSRL